MTKPIASDIRDLIVNPENGSMVMSLAHHALFRPADALARQFGGRMPKQLDPQVWGAAAARAAEKVDFHLAPSWSHRHETITLTGDHLRGIGKHLDGLIRDGHTAKAQSLKDRLNLLVAKHYNSGEGIEGLIAKAHADKEFAATFHNVKVPSLTGEVGRTAKNVSTDIAALVGAQEIQQRLAEATSQDPSPGVKKGHEVHMELSELERAAEMLEKAAAIYESIPDTENAQKYAHQLLDAGVIAKSEMDKYASMFERNPEDAETIVEGMLRDRDHENKSASLGEVVFDDPIGSSKGFGRFEQLCIEGAELT